MRSRSWRTAALILSLAVGFSLAAQGQAMDKKEAATLLKESARSLGEAQKASRGGEAAEIAQHAVGYTEAMNRVSEALSRSRFDSEDLLDVAGRLDEATLKHQPVLEGLLEKVPEQARGAIARALEASRMGQERAAEAVTNHAQADLPNGVLTDRSARDAMKKNEALVRQAERAQKRGDNATLARSAEQYGRNIGTVSDAIERNRVEQADAVSILDRVNSNTLSHVSVLEGLLGKVPEQARPALERAIAMSQQGNQAATAALNRTPAAGRAAGRPGVGGPPSGIGGPPSGVGGPPSGVGGPPAGAGGGPPAGVGGRPR